MQNNINLIDTERYFYNILAYDASVREDILSDSFVGDDVQRPVAIKISVIYKTENTLSSILNTEAGSINTVYSKLEEKLRRFMPLIGLHFLGLYGLNLEAVRVGDEPIVVVTTSTARYLKQVLEVFHLISCKYEGRSLDLDNTYLLDVSSIPGIDALLRHYFKIIPRFLMDNLYISFHLYTIEN